MGLAAGGWGGSGQMHDTRDRMQLPGTGVGAESAAAPPGGGDRGGWQGSKGAAGVWEIGAVQGSSFIPPSLSPPRSEAADVFRHHSSCC
jgi:hypothetical protein